MTINENELSGAASTCAGGSECSTSCTPQTNTGADGSARIDGAGALASSLCAVHCMVGAVLPAALGSLGFGFLLGHEVEWAFTAAALAFASAALVLGWRRHRSPIVAALFVLGIMGLEHISKTPEQNHSARQVEKSQEVACLSLPPSGDAAEPLQPGEETLDEPASSIATHGASILLPTAGARASALWSDEFDVALLHERLRVLSAVPGAVADQSRGQFIDECSVESSVGESNVVSVSWSNSDSEWKTMTVCDCHDLGRLACSTAADFGPPFFAGT